MKAAISRSYGPPDTIELSDVPKPVPKDDEILIAVHAAGVNRTDDGFLRAKPFVVRLFSGLRKPKSQILGCEFAGVVEEVGADVTEFSIGDKVFGFDDGRFGGHGQYMTIKASAAVTDMPKNASFEQAAASTEGAHYAVSYVQKIVITSGQKILVNGGTGSIGSAAIQIMAYIGADITATAPTDHLERVRKLGAKRVIDYTKEDFTQTDETFDIVFDAVGKSSYKACKQLLKPRGIYSSSELGPFPWNPLLALLTRLTPGKKVLFPLPRNTKQILSYIRDLTESGDFAPLIDSTYPLEDIVVAYQRVESGEKIGNVVITM